MPEQPLVSIITPSFNQAGFIEATIESVLTQDYPNIEYLVIDGGSTDGTLDILRRYEGRLKWISERDQGQADAINKGMSRATGQILGWLNSDDLYVPGAIRSVVETFTRQPEAMFVYGDAEAIDEHDNSYGTRIHVHQTDADELIQMGDPIVQPASFWRAEVWQTCGELDLSLHYTLDYEYWMRVAKRYPLTYIPVILAKERLYAGAKTFKGAIERVDELEAVARRHGGDGIARRFSGEGAAAYANRGVGRLVRGQWKAARGDFARARALNPDPKRFIMFFGVSAVMGSKAIAQARLSQNQRFQSRKQGVKYPSDDEKWRA
ncbi:MAG: glycosyltransferase [Anaerolineae bacterium]|nr:glycosyltransferase [Anaerolineae bacterium]